MRKSNFEIMSEKFALWPVNRNVKGQEEAEVKSTAIVYPMIATDAEIDLLNQEDLNNNVIRIACGDLYVENACPKFIPVLESYPKEKERKTLFHKADKYIIWKNRKMDHSVNIPCNREGKALSSRFKYKEVINAILVALTNDEIESLRIEMRVEEGCMPSDKQLLQEAKKRVREKLKTFDAFELTYVPYAYSVEFKGVYGYDDNTTYDMQRVRFYKFDKSDAETMQQLPKIVEAVNKRKMSKEHGKTEEVIK